MPVSIVTNHAVKSDRDGYGYKGMKDKQMDRWKSEYNGRRRVRKYSDVKDLERKKLGRSFFCFFTEYDEFGKLGIFGS